MSALYVPHFRRVTFLGNEDSGLVIFVQHQLDWASKQTFPQGQGGKALLIHKENVSETTSASVVDLDTDVCRLLSHAKGKWVFGPLRTRKPPDVDFASLSPA